MAAIIAGGVDCDLHPAVPHLTSLLPYMNDYWRDQVTTRGMTDLVSQSYPPHSPISSRPDWRPAQGKPGASLDDMKTQALDPFRVAFGICNPLFGVQMVFSEDMQDAFCRALNDWLKGFCHQRGCTYLDYYSSMIDRANLLRTELSDDGLHPNSDGYRVMAPLALEAIGRVTGSAQQNTSSARQNSKKRQ